jgi:hypothetical protein
MWRAKVTNFLEMGDVPKHKIFCDAAQLSEVFGYPASFAAMSNRFDELRTRENWGHRSQLREGYFWRLAANFGI